MNLISSSTEKFLFVDEKFIKSSEVTVNLRLNLRPGPSVLLSLHRGEGWHFKENQNRLAPGRLRRGPSKIFSFLAKLDNGLCLICCWWVTRTLPSQVRNVTRSPRGPITETSQAGNLSKNHFSWGIMQDCYRGQYLQILSRVRYTLLGSYLRDKDRLGSFFVKSSLGWNQFKYG